MVEGKFYYIARAAGEASSSFYEKCGFIREDGSMGEMVVFYPEYYRSMAVRLYVFEGMRVVPDSVTVVALSPARGPDGKKRRVIEETLDFADFEQASEFIEAAVPGRYRIAGFSPFKSPVPLEELEQYRLVWRSGVAGVKIFEFISAMPAADVRREPQTWHPPDS